MKTIYIYLNQEDKTKLKKLAQAKMLSLSACVDIICQEYQFFFSNSVNYIKKGNLKTKLNIRSKATWQVSDKLATNCIYAYFHNECLEFYPNKAGIKNVNRKIQSNLDKTIDNNYLKNIIIRTTYRTNKGQLA